MCFIRPPELKGDLLRGSSDPTLGEASTSRLTGYLDGQQDRKLFDPKYFVNLSPSRVDTWPLRSPLCNALLQ